MADIGKIEAMLEEMPPLETSGAVAPSNTGVLNSSLPTELRKRLRMHIGSCVRPNYDANYGGMVHYTNLKKGLKAAYLAENDTNIDYIVREALEMEDVMPQDPLEIDTRMPYIIQGEEETIYNTRALIDGVGFRILAPHDASKKVVVGLHIRWSESVEVLKEYVRWITDTRLVPARLEPLPSSRNQIPSYLLAR